MHSPAGRQQARRAGMNPLDAAGLFPDCYATARKQFRDAALRAGCELEAHAIDGRAPDGAELSIDVAILAGDGAPRSLVISSGLHGIEGPLGSAVQTGMLREWALPDRRFPGVRLVLLHALNPFGYAWRRRVNEANVDVNRNFLLAGQAYRGSPPGYAALYRLLNPQRPPSRLDPVALRFLVTILRHGMPALKQSIVSGQYDFPRGLFYGGDRPSRSAEILAAHLGRWLGGSSEVMHLDFHTGLGASGQYKLLIDGPTSAAQQRRLAHWFGAGAIESADAAGTAYTTLGSLGPWCAEQHPGRDYLFATAEFGTYAPTRVLAGLRAENQAQHWGRPDSASTERARQRLAELFCPAAARWRERALAQGLALVRQAGMGLAGTAPPGSAVCP
jgi:predicted deacylase